MKSSRSFQIESPRENRNGAVSAKPAKSVSTARKTSLHLLLNCFIVGISACSDGDPVSGGADTPFGSRPEVEAYRALLNPVIDAANEVQGQVQEQAGGTGNVATAENLNAVYELVRPLLLEALVELDRILPPAALVALHEDVRLLLVLRLDAQALVMEGFAGDDGEEENYRQAETKLEGANALIPGLNSRLCEIDNAINSNNPAACEEDAIS